MFAARTVRPLYIGGRGFDVRSLHVLDAFVSSLQGAAAEIVDATLLLVGFDGYQLDDDIIKLTQVNADGMAKSFSRIGTTLELPVGTGHDDGETTTTVALRDMAMEVLSKIDGATDVILDVSSLPRIVYLTLLTSILSHLVSKDPPIDNDTPHPLEARGVNFQVLVGEDASLDAEIRAEDPSNTLVLIPGYSAVLQTESLLEWPLVWFPILGENRINQLEKVLASGLIPDTAEVCPVLPQPSRDPRRADRLLVEYKTPLFETGRTVIGNLLHAHESHPFEAYRQLLGAMRRYRKSMEMLGGVRLAVTPLGSKLITLGAGLACFEMQPSGLNEGYGVGIPYAEPTRYVVSVDRLMQSSTPEISALLLTGEAYSRGEVAIS